MKKSSEEGLNRKTRKEVVKRGTEKRKQLPPNPHVSTGKKVKLQVVLRERKGNKRLQRESEKKKWTRSLVFEVGVLGEGVGVYGILLLEGNGALKKGKVEQKGQGAKTGLNNIK